MNLNRKYSSAPKSKYGEGPKFEYTKASTFFKYRRQNIETNEKK